MTELLGMFMHCLCILAASNEQKRFEYCFVSSMYNGGVSVSDFGRKSTCVRVHESILFLASAQVLNVWWSCNLFIFSASFFFFFFFCPFSFCFLSEEFILAISWTRNLYGSEWAFWNPLLEIGQTGNHRIWNLLNKPKFWFSEWAEMKFLIWNLVW